MSLFWLQDIVEERRGALDKVNIATAIYSLAHLGEAALGKQGQSIGAAQQFLPFLHDLSDMARSTVKDMDTQSLSNTAWACAKLGELFSIYMSVTPLSIEGEYTYIFP